MDDRKTLYNITICENRLHRYVSGVRKYFKSIAADTQGFTLVEFVVVLVIISILAATIGPALIGYIDKAKKNETIGNAKKIYMAAQNLADQAHTDYVNPVDIVTEEKISEITQIDLADGKASYAIRYKNPSWDSANPTDAMYYIDEFTYDEAGYRVIYMSSTRKWEIVNAN